MRRNEYSCLILASNKVAHVVPNTKIKVQFKNTKSLQLFEPCFAPLS